MLAHGVGFLAGVEGAYLDVDQVVRAGVGADRIALTVESADEELGVFLVRDRGYLYNEGARGR